MFIHILELLSVATAFLLAINMFLAKIEGRVPFLEGHIPTILRSAITEHWQLRLIVATFTTQLRNRRS